MRSTTARIGVLAALAAVAVVLFIVLSDDEGDDAGGGGGASTGTQLTATSAQPSPEGAAEETIAVQDGSPVGGVKRIEVDKGERVRLEVRLDQPEEDVHVHGYEITEPARQSPVRVSFPADLDGVFQVELHRAGGSDVQIAELRVSP